MKALLINGSPRKEGHTHTALQFVGDGLRESGIEVPGEDGSNEWLEPVADEEYRKLP